MKVGDWKPVKGCFTQEKYIAGRSLIEMERILGFGNGRFALGITVFTLLHLPEMGQFDVAGYSNVATHHHTTPQDLDIARLKSNARARWAVTGPDRLARVEPVLQHNPSADPDLQYPPGFGAPQWRLKVLVLARVSGIVTDYPSGRYVAA